MSNHFYFCVCCNYAGSVYFPGGRDRPKYCPSCYRRKIERVPEYIPFEQKWKYIMSFMKKHEQEKSL